MLSFVAFFSVCVIFYITGFCVWVENRPIRYRNLLESALTEKLNLQQEKNNNNFAISVRGTLFMVQNIFQILCSAFHSFRLTFQLEHHGYSDIFRFICSPFHSFRLPRCSIHVCKIMNLTSVECFGLRPV